MTSNCPVDVTVGDLVPLDVEGAFVVSLGLELTTTEDRHFARNAIAIGERDNVRLLRAAGATSTTTITRAAGRMNLQPPPAVHGVEQGLETDGHAAVELELIRILGVADQIAAPIRLHHQPTESVLM